MNWVEPHQAPWTVPRAAQTLFHVQGEIGTGFPCATATAFESTTRSPRLVLRNPAEASPSPHVTRPWFGPRPVAPACYTPETPRTPPRCPQPTSTTASPRPGWPKCWWPIMPAICRCTGRKRSSAAPVWRSRVPRWAPGSHRADQGGGLRLHRGPGGRVRRPGRSWGTTPSDGSGTGCRGKASSCATTSAATKHSSARRDRGRLHDPCAAQVRRTAQPQTLDFHRSALLRLTNAAGRRQYAYPRPSESARCCLSPVCPSL
jgi:hypothetical protein